MTEQLPVGAIVAAALEAANYPGDSGEDVDRFLAELTQRGYVVVKREAPCSRCGSDWHYTDEHVPVEETA